jgi:hypothetical protein
MVKNGISQMAHSDFVDVGKGEGYGERHLFGILDDAPYFSTEIARGTGDMGQDIFVSHEMDFQTTEKKTKVGKV